MESIADQFDIILLDPPPALGMLSLSVLRAANALLVPAPPNNIDFASTAHFLKMMEATLAELARAGGARHYSFVKVLASKMNDQKSAHLAIKRMMDAVFPQDMLTATLKDSAEIDNATANLGTVYELTGAATRTETHKRCRAYLDAVGREIELLARKTWPSHHRAASGGIAVKRHQVVVDDILKDMPDEAAAPDRAGARFLNRSNALADKGSREEKTLRWVDPEDCVMGAAQPRL